MMPFLLDTSGDPERRRVRQFMLAPAEGEVAQV